MYLIRCRNYKSIMCTSVLKFLKYGYVPDHFWKYGIPGEVNFIIRGIVFIIAGNIEAKSFEKPLGIDLTIDQITNEIDFKFITHICKGNEF